MKLKKCFKCDQERVIWKNFEGNKYCKTCWLSNFNNSTIYNNNDNKKIKQRSEKKIELDKIYFKLRKIFLEKYPICQANTQNCTNYSTDVHHKSQRGDNYLVIATWLSVCRTCHSWIHLNPQEARDKNLLE